MAAASIKFLKKPKIGIIAGIIALVAITSYFGYTQIYTKTALLAAVERKNETLMAEIDSLKKEFEELKNQDQIKINKDLTTEINNIQKTYKQSISVYEDLTDLKAISKDTKKLDDLYALAISILANRDYSQATDKLNELAKNIADEKAKVTVASAPATANVPQNNTPPGSGYSRQTVNSDTGSFVVSIVAADLGSTKVIVDTASDSDCSNNCPVLPLATYVSRSGAFAGVNGTYFCPAEYPSCAGKTGTFDLLVMNKNKTYFNSGNNVYSNNPIVVFQSGSMRFIGSGSGWGRDTGVDGVLMNYPLLVNGGNVSFGGDDDPKKGSKGNRSFVANKGSIGYIGVVHSATVAEAARVLKTMGMENALNLDDGGSTALWSGGYKVGPGRNLPNVILFVKK
ncbi:MAG: hypothetical protein US96_C0016G0014 [Candidatus Woesebacteria bacterium GW2011_GWB1_38_5b]|uniref:Phosphodiester glycosidase domain-containing protein n=1 Tax=Candidatus Woesebacteria bacterium GW2011_GWB1_38_5b TaxID=1618569 RepID=A0A0G0KI28_9BACT|nr:MAG: hypothetical protein US96_C0016G0014 [Candidatus Woesebacteria bacterium GW2011_GWB1_38_5b]